MLRLTSSLIHNSMAFEVAGGIGAFGKLPPFPLN
jgi:hypothetical protein